MGGSLGAKTDVVLSWVELRCTTPAVLVVVAVCWCSLFVMLVWSRGMLVGDGFCNEHHAVEKEKYCCWLQWNWQEWAVKFTTGNS